jgi:hypothetical protein
MAANKQKTEAKLDHVVIAVKRRGLEKFVTAYGPFSKAHAYAFAAYHGKYARDECCVKQMEEPCDHKQWIFQGIQED